jgi:hypothetical protein
MTNKTWMYKFDVTNKVNKDNGETVEEKAKLALLKPNRKLKEDGELFYAKEVSRFAKAGVLPKAAWGTILSNGGGSISEKEREVYGELLLKFRDASFELQSILIKTESERTEAEKKRSDEIIIELDEIRKEIQSFESSQISIFENTAEAKARNRTILWWVLFTSYIEKNGEYVSFFDGETFDEKLNSYDIFEDLNSENNINLIAIRRLTYLITLWFLGKVETEEDFDSFYQNLIKESEEVVVEDKVEEKTEIVSTEKTVEEKAVEEKVVVEKIETINVEEISTTPVTPA